MIDLDRLRALAADIRETCERFGLELDDADFLNDVAAEIERLRAESVCDLCRVDDVQDKQPARICRMHYRLVASALPQAERRESQI